MYTTLNRYISNLDINLIPNERKAALELLVNDIQTQIRKEGLVRLAFICTHNSRRSQLAQVWMQTLAHHFKIKNIACYSSGTETTRIYPRVVNHLNAIGFQVHTLVAQDNPIYTIKYDENEAAVLGFSKTLNHPFNPRSNFTAIMTCDEADQACPMVMGAQTRISLPYEDPKVYDNMQEEKEMYELRSAQIARELKFVLNEINP